MEIARFDEASQNRALMLLLGACPKRLPEAEIRDTMAGTDPDFNLYYLASAGFCTVWPDPVSGGKAYAITAKGIDWIRSL